MRLTRNSIYFLIRWVLPPVFSALIFFLIFLKGAIVKILAAGEISLSVLFESLMVTVLAGLFAGLSYSLHRPYLRPYQKVGDIITGILSMNFYFLSIMVVDHYVYGEPFMWDRPGGLYLFVFSTAGGVIIGWNSFFTTLENMVLNPLREKQN